MVEKVMAHPLPAKTPDQQVTIVLECENGVAYHTTNVAPDNKWADEVEIVVYRASGPNLIFVLSPSRSTPERRIFRIERQSAGHD